MKTAEQTSRIGYFYNEKGDYTITLYDEPIAFTKDQNSAQRLVNSFKSLTLRIDTLSKMAQSNKESLEAYNRECKRVDELTEEVAKKQERIQDLEKLRDHYEKDIVTKYGKIAELEGLLRRSKSKIDEAALMFEDTNQQDIREEFSSLSLEIKKSISTREETKKLFVKEN